MHELPLFPLPQAVLFPGALMPLHVFEARYRRMTRDALDTHKVLAVAQLVSGAEGPDGQPAIAPVAGVGVIVESRELPDGRFHILLEGRARVRLAELPFVPPYRRARGELLEDRTADVPDLEQRSLLAVANAFAAFVQSRDPSFSFGLPPSLPSARLADLCAHHLVLDATARQTMLECLDPVARVRLVSEAIALQLATLKRDANSPVH